MQFRFSFLLVILIVTASVVQAQNLYTARAYWEESTKPTYRNIKQKQERGDSLTVDEKNYVKDYEAYLLTYYQRMPKDAQEDYLRLKSTWDKDLALPTSARAGDNEPFEWRTKDRLANGIYGLYYGLAIVGVGGITDAPAAGIPLITSGIWMLGPAINAKKYENITRPTIRAANSGKLLGLVYGAGLGLVLGGEETNENKWVLGVSAVTSILMGEIAFQQQKVKNHSSGHIEMMRHYGFLGPWVDVASAVGAGVDNDKVAGGAILIGGIGGLIIGNSVANKYDYSRGDVDAISSLTLIATGVGFAAMSESLKTNSDLKSLYFIPAATSIAGTLIGQRSIRGVHLTDQQGSTLNLATAGSALVGLGAVAMTKSESPAVWIGVPTALALITYEILFNKYKNKNLSAGLRGSLDKDKRFDLSLKVSPESYFINKQLPVKDYSPQQFAAIQNPLFKLTLTF